VDLWDCSAKRTKRAKDRRGGRRAREAKMVSSASDIAFTAKRERRMVGMDRDREGSLGVASFCF